MKETKKQIKAQLINEVRKQYERKVADIEQNRDYWRTCAIGAQNDNAELIRHKHSLENENAALKDKLAKYEEWVERMQDFCNMPEGERQQAFKTYLDGIKAKTEHDQAMATIGSMFGRMASLFTL